MATHRMSLLGGLVSPDASGNVFIEPYTVKATNDVWKHPVVIYNDTATRDGLYGAFTVPKNYVGTAKIVIVWTASATSGDVEWDFDYRTVGGNDTTSLDQSGTEESVNSNDTAPGAAHRRLEFLLTLTAGNFAVDDLVEWGLFRDGTDGGDTMAAAAIVHDVLFEYADA